MPERHQGGENQSTQREAKEMKMEKAQIEKKKISVFTLSAPQSPFAAALLTHFANVKPEPEPEPEQ